MLQNLRTVHVVQHGGICTSISYRRVFHTSTTRQGKQHPKLVTRAVQPRTRGTRNRFFRLRMRSYAIMVRTGLMSRLLCGAETMQLALRPKWYIQMITGLERTRAAQREITQDPCQLGSNSNPKNALLEPLNTRLMI
jgi:hypothetical protein